MVMQMENDIKAILRGDPIERLITNPDDYRIGDFVIFDGDGPAFTVLSWTLGRFDEDWKNLERKPWHVAFISRRDPDGTWWVSEAKGGTGITESRLDSFKEPYLVFRWFDVAPEEAKVKEFIDTYRGEKYDAFWGYAFVILWYFWKSWPLIIDYKWMCWEWLWFFAAQFGKPIDNVHKYPLITLLLVRIKYPGYGDIKIAFVKNFSERVIDSFEFEAMDDFPPGYQAYFGENNTLHLVDAEHPVPDIIFYTYVKKGDKVIIKVTDL